MLLNNLKGQFAILEKNAYSLSCQESDEKTMSLSYFYGKYVAAASSWLAVFFSVKTTICLLFSWLGATFVYTLHTLNKLDIMC